MTSRVHNISWMTWNSPILLSALLIHGGDPALPGVIDAGIGHQQVLRLLDPHRLIIDQHLDGLPPEALIHIDPEVVEPNLALLAHLAGQLAEAEDPPQAARFDRRPRALPRMTSGDR